MPAKQKAILVKFIIWLAAEFLLGGLGMDTLADYGEFIFERSAIVDVRSPA